MLDDGDISFDDLLIHIIFRAISFHRVKLRLCAHMVDRLIEQISLGRADFTDAPVVAAHIVVGGKLPVLVRGVSVNQFLAFIDTVNCARKGSVALRRSRFRIGLCHGHIEFLEDVGKAALRDLVPLNGCGLGCGNDIADSGIHFLKDIRGVAADEDILKPCHTVGIGHSVLIHRKPA